MKNDQNSSSLLDSLDNQQIRKIVSKLEIDPISLPVTSSTRSLHLKKLLKHLQSNNIKFDEQYLQNLLNEESEVKKTRKSMTRLESLERSMERPKSPRRTRMSYNPMVIDSDGEDEQPAVVAKASPRKRASSKPATKPQSPRRRASSMARKDDSEDLSMIETTTQEVLKTPGATLKSSTPTNSARKQTPAAQAKKTPITYSDAVSQMRSTKPSKLNLASGSRSSRSASAARSNTVQQDQSPCFSIFLKWLKIFSILTVLCIAVAALYWGLVDSQDGGEHLGTENALDRLEDE